MVTAAFTATPNTGIAPLFVECDSSGSLGVITTWAWDFDDGDTSIVANPTHLFDVGVYTVELTVGDGVDTDTITAVVTVSAPPEVVSDSRLWLWEGFAD